MKTPLRQIKFFLFSWHLSMVVISMYLSRKLVIAVVTKLDMIKL
jgi:hypothetical protein